MSSLAIGNATVALPVALPLPTSSQGTPTAASTPSDISSQTNDFPVSQQHAAAPTADLVQQAMDRVQQAVAAITSNNLQFNVDNETGKTIVKIIDSQTKEVVKQIPSEDMLAIAKSLDNFQGLFLKQKA